MLKSIHFKKRGIFFFPVSITGWLAMAVVLAYLVFSFIAIDSRSHSVSDTLINFLLQVVLAWSGYTIFALMVHIFKDEKERF